MEHRRAAAGHSHHGAGDSHHGAGGHTHHGTGGHTHTHDDPAMLEYRELDSEVLAGYWSDVLSWVAEASVVQPRRILDLGAGTGVAAIGLAQRFTHADVIALDISAGALEVVRAGATKSGCADRVITLEADLDAAWPPELAELDLIWASMSLHHMADPDDVLRSLHAATRPGGLIAVAEKGTALRLLPDDVGVGRPGFEARCLDLEAVELAHTLPTLGADWAARLRAAGFDILEERTFALDAPTPVMPATARYTQLRLERFRSGLADQLAEDDLETLNALLDESGPHFVGARTDFIVEGSRALTLATVS